MRKVYFFGKRKQFKEWMRFLMLRFGPDRCLKDMPNVECR